MTRGLLLLALLVSVGCRRPSSSSASFEGEIVVESYPYGLQVWLKGDRERVEMLDFGTQTGGALIVDRAGKTLSTVSRDGTTYSETALDTSSKTHLVATASGKKETIAGHVCDVLNVAEPAGRREICLARDLPDFAMNLGPTSDARGYEPSFGHGFPLRIYLYDATGKLTAKMGATHIDAKPVADALVHVPASAKKVAAR
jgi:hypothetical protein